MRFWIKSENYIVVIIYIVLIVHPYIVNTPLVVWLHVCFMEGFTGENLVRVCSFVPSLKSKDSSLCCLKEDRSLVVWSGLIFPRSCCPSITNLPNSRSSYVPYPISLSYAEVSNILAHLDWQDIHMGAAASPFSFLHSRGQSGESFTSLSFQESSQGAQFTERK